MTDGTSNCIVVGERCTPASEANTSVGNATWVSCIDRGTQLGRSSAYGDAAQRINVNVASGTVVSTAGATLPSQPTVLAARIQHSAASTQVGAHFLLGDGTVKFISENIDITFYRNLARINAGNVIGEFLIESGRAFVLSNFNGDLQSDPCDSSSHGSLSFFVTLVIALCECDWWNGDVFSADCDEVAG